MAEVVCVGELLVDFVPTVSGTGLADAPAFKKAPGGAPANVAVGLARLGTSSAFMGKVGDDAFGLFLARTLLDAGVDVGPLRLSAEARTALAFVTLRADGEREFLFYRNPSADMLFAPEEVDADAIRAARALHFGSISLIGEPSRSATLRAVALARQGGALVSYDPNLRLALWPDAAAARAGMLRGWEEAEIAKVSEEELDFLVGTRDLAAVRRALWHDRLRLVAVTRGAAGCTFVTRDLAEDVPGFAVQTVDTTGAGDGFVAGLLHRLLAAPGALDDPRTLREACRFANAVGALTTTERGAIPALPTLPRVEALLAGVRPSQGSTTAGTGA
ncbi:PfkB family carbohydrate kinase [Anaeromyxobacter oryzae]|uniref:Fructokinase n=1 Tax=Anaeromyxobacter oryzae TaxID=2918170 RepID=A0ABM7WQ95_9BACT|nr:PfkB family carbohydrate kinase [Anaeromyxobacter oryzae]BDG01635.1 fructokinase [Anaeromyxobacter oryzae]